MAGAANNVNRQATPSAQVAAPVPPWLGVLPRQLWGTVKDLFVYVVEFIPLGAGAVDSDSFTIEADSDFIGVYGTVVVTDEANTVFVDPAPILVNVRDSGSGRSASSNPLPMSSLFGTGKEPAYWSMPKLLRAGSTVTVEVQNLDAANARNVRLAIHGFKSFGFQR